MPLPQPQYENSAGRLLAILTAIPREQSYLNAIPKFFELPSGTQAEQIQSCIAALDQIRQLYDEFCADVLHYQTNPQQGQVLLGGLSELPQTFSPMQLNSQLRAPTVAERSLIEVAATIIPVDGALPDDDIASIRTSIAELRGVVEYSDISPSLRAVLLDLIRMSEDAIAHFNIRGAKGLKRAWMTMLGETVAFYATQPRDSSGSDTTSTWTKIKKHLQLLDTVASKLMRYKPLFEAAKVFFLPGDGHNKQ